MSKYSLRQLIGKRVVKGEVQEIANPIDEILIEDATKTNGFKRIGFVSRHNGAGCTFTVWGMPLAEQEEAASAVAELRTQLYGFKTAARYSGLPTIPPQDEPEEMDFDE